MYYTRVCTRDILYSSKGKRKANQKSKKQVIRFAYKNETFREDKKNESRVQI